MAGAAAWAGQGTKGELEFSSRHQGVSDDLRKDQDNLAWLAAVSGEERQMWLERVRAIRVADRLAEEALLRAAPVPAAPLRERLAELPDLPGLSQADNAWGEAWSEYLAAIEESHQPDFRVRTRAEYDALALRLSGSLFALFPFLGEREAGLIRAFGALDQYLNHLRDLAEDARCGICPFPEEELERFGLRPADLGLAWGEPAAATHWGEARARAAVRARAREFLARWLDEALPLAWEQARRFIEAPGLHPSVALMRADCVGRYRRIERTLRDCGLDPRAFERRYWGQG